jgi:hypothetical protein
MKISTKRGERTAVACLSLLGIFASHCSSSTTDAPGANDGGDATQTIGASGGSITSGDSSVSIVIPAGALATDTAIAIRSNPTATAPSGAIEVGTPYTFSPDGLQFSKPVTVTMAFDASRVPTGIAASSVMIESAPDGSTTYTALATTLVDSSHVSTTTTHFSTYVPVTLAQVTALDAGTACQADSAAGHSAPFPSCETSSPCSTFPGTTVAACTDNATGYTASCCPANDGGSLSDSDGGSEGDAAMFLDASR